jgi:putative peptidoglycan lipid II flippase
VNTGSHRVSAPRPQPNPPKLPANDGLAGTRASLGRASGVMAVGTTLSRATGFLRTAVILAALGINPVSDAYNLANTAPNILYDLLLGGVLSAVIVPVLVRAARDDKDGGEDFGCSLLTLVGIGLTAAVIVGMVFAPQIIHAYSDADAATQELSVTFLRYFLIQVLFYGLGATIGAILNVRGRFAAPMITPVLNNLVVIVTGFVFILLPGPQPPTVHGITHLQIAVLAGGTTLGVIVMTVALLPSLHACGFRYRPRFDIRHPGLKAARGLAGWMLLYVAANQVAFLITARLAGQVKGTFTAYSAAYQLFQLPHAIVAVSVITALLPRMSAHAASRQRIRLVEDTSRGLRSTSVVIVPAAVGMAVLATPLSIMLFAYHNNSIADAARIGHILAGFAIALIPFSVFQLLLRVCYAEQDSRTPAMVNVWLSAANIFFAYVLAFALPDRDRGLGLAIAFALSYLLGVVMLLVRLHRRYGHLDGPRVTRQYVRVVIASLLAGLVTAVLATLIQALLGHGHLGSTLAVLVGGGVGIGCYVALARRMRIVEVTELITMVRARLP